MATNLSPVLDRRCRHVGLWRDCRRLPAQRFVAIERFLPEGLLAELQAETNSKVAAARKGRLAGPNFDVIGTPGGGFDLRRIANPEENGAVYDRVMRFKPLIDLVAHLLGGTVRFDHAKLNFKPPGGGGALDWHQDFAFYPQTNDDMLAVGVMIEDSIPENGPLLVVPGSHRHEVYDHHQHGVFVGGIPADRLNGVTESAVALTAPAGSVSIHHARTLHASDRNRGGTNRPLLLLNYFAVDAFPVFHGYDWGQFQCPHPARRAGRLPALCAGPLQGAVPHAGGRRPPRDGSIFDTQADMTGELVLERQAAAT